MIALAVRIFLRYLAGYLVLHGFISDGDGSMLASDPDVAVVLEMALGAGIGLSVEAWTMFARRMGWAT